MNPYRIAYTSNGLRELERLPRDIRPRVAASVLALAGEPRPHGCVKLSGGDELWRIRIGQYRVVYSIDDRARLVTITRARHRGDVYRT